MRENKGFADEIMKYSLIRAKRYAAIHLFVEKYIPLPWIASKKIE